MDNGMNVKEWFESVQDWTQKEIDRLNDKVENLELINEELKFQLLESDEQKLMISKLQEDLKIARKSNQSSNQFNTEMTKIIVENKTLLADKMNFFYVIQEIIKGCKKRKESKIENALKMLS